MCTPAHNVLAVALGDLLDASIYVGHNVESTAATHRSAGTSRDPMVSFSTRTAPLDIVREPARGREGQG